MAVYKLLDDFYEHSYTLIAIHGSLEDYRLVYFLNLNLNVKLKRLGYDVQMYEDANFALFEWYDTRKEVYWNLLSNRTKVLNKEKVTDSNIFEERMSFQTKYVIPEYSKVDYFLKIDNEGKYPQTALALQRIKEIPQVITAYEVDPEMLKSKNNLIFLANA